MDLTQNLNTIRTAIERPPSDGKSSQGSIKVTEDFGCAQNCGDDQCPVCLEKDVNTMLLPCNHRFHGDCILQWVDHSFSCPMCRTEVTHFLPLSHMNKETQNAFIQIWDKHYVTRQPPALAPQRINYGKMMSNEKRGRISCSPMKTTSFLGRSKSFNTLSLANNHCHTCSNPFENAYVYIAFDHKFCNAQCRLKYAKNNKKDMDGGDEHATTSFYVDYTQTLKYMS